MELCNVTKAYGSHIVLQNLSCTIPEGSALGIMAPSGTGKTTLLRLILGLEQPDSGRITGIPGCASVVFQEDRLCPGLTVEANLRLALGKRTPLEPMLRQLGLWESRQLPACQLSGGMARRTALARALLHESPLLVLDEPFSGLDEAARLQAARVICQYRQNRTLLLVTHRQEDLALLGIETVLNLETP